MQFENVEFDAGFDSGNLREVQESLDGFPELADRFTNGGKSKPIHSKADKTFYLWTRNDGQTKNRTWFYFSMQVKSTERMNVELRFMNLNRVQNLFKMGMRPLLRHEQMPKWQRIPTQPLTQYTSLGMEMAFCLSFSPDGQIHPQMGTMRQPCPPGKYYLAYCLPYTYKQAQARIRFLEKLFALEHLSSQIPRLKTRRRIYFHRDILIHTLDGRNLDLLTVSSMEKIKTSREVDIEGLYPEGGSRSHEFDKPCFFISARVHPGETISSYMMDGFVDFIISDDPRAIQLRDHFVFKIVPMVNPDGVYRGHYRGDNNGVNLNRVYDNPNKEQYPTIWAIVQLIQTLNLEWYIDLHGHANKPGTFLFGNWIPDLTKQHQMMTFARAMHLNSHVFDMTECDFAPKQMVQQSTKVENR
ncbi:hypothetical protein EDD86DRAFT_134370 [Gorgonomyces haynaldii]|nr:hypothetical protein EDD86DRAFT_134370 [Gorgonomyces haynaldii]